MYLLDLAPELLDQIFEHVGSRFFQKDLRRLSLSRRWYAHARRMVAQELWFSSAMLEYFLRGRDEEAVLARRITSLQRLRLYLHGLYPEPTATFRAACQSLAQEPDLGHTGPWMAWREDARQQLLNFCQILVSQRSQLRTLHIFVERELEPNIDCRESVTQCVGTRAIDTLLQGLSTLTFLELDLNEPGRLSDSHQIFSGEWASQINDHQVHLCETVGSLLRHLVRLRLRTDPICAAAIGSPNAIINPKLKEITINLSLQFKWLGYAHSRSEAKECDKASKIERCLKRSLIDHMRRLRQTLEAPEHLRILYHRLDGDNSLRAYDVVDIDDAHTDEPSFSAWHTPREAGPQRRTGNCEPVTFSDAFTTDKYALGHIDLFVPL